MGKTAAELMVELAKNKEFQEKKVAREKHFSDLEKKYASDEKSLVDELNQAGFSVSSVWDFVNAKNDYLNAEPILVSHLKVQHHPKILAGIARSLAIAAFSGNDELWELLIDLYNKTPSDLDIETPEERGLQQAIATALACLTTSPRVADLEKLVTKNPDGDGIQWLQETLKEFGY